MECSPPGSSIHGIFQARVLEWVVIAFSDILHSSLLNECTRVIGKSLMAQSVKNPPAVQETRIQSLGWEVPLEEGMAPVFLPGEFHG